MDSSTFGRFVAPPIAAGVAIVPVFYGMMCKSSLQLGEPLPRLQPSVLTAGLKAAPTIGVIVGTQMVTQGFVENALLKLMSKDSCDGNSSMSTMLLSTSIVGMVSAPALAVFNGQTMGRTASQSLRALSGRQVFAIITRETGFLFSLRISDPLAEAAQEKFGKNRALEVGMAFASGFLGSYIGQPGDTALTLWQRNKQVEGIRHLMRGGVVKGIAVGGFAVTYQFVNQLIQG